MKYQHLFLEKTPAIITSSGEYSTIEFTDGSSYMASYTQKELGRRFGHNLKMVKRGVYVNPKEAIIIQNGVKIMNREFKFSRRMAKAWACMLLVFFYLDSFCQNTAPVAHNDTLKVCNDVPTYFTVTRNDTDADGDRLKLNYFSEPASGNLVSASNTGYFRYEWNPLFSSASFEYNLKDLKFANLGSLTSNMATVVLNSAAPYYYTGTYTGTNTRETCRSINTAAVTISGTTIESNTAYQSIILDGSIGTVTISPTAGGSVEFKIK